MTTRVSIFGSCVSRDTLEFAAEGTYKLTRYIARQSLVSAFDHHGPWELDLTEMASQFQQRMAQADLDSEFSRILPKIAEDSDLLLMDLTDERLGFYEMPDGSIVTRSVDLIGAGIDTELQRIGRHVPFGSREHYQRWCTALADLDLLLTEHPFRDRIRLLAIPWATHDTTGAEITYTASVPIGRANRAYRQYYRAASRVLPVIRPSAGLAVEASQEHRWGLAPFHYADTVYKDILWNLGMKARG